LQTLAPLLLPGAARCAEEAAPSLREAAMGFMVEFALRVWAVRFFNCVQPP
jgi:hypothetical protein